MPAPRCQLRIGPALALVGALAAAAPAAAAEELLGEVKAAKAKYAADIERVAAVCDSLGLKAEARRTRDVLGRHDPYKLYLPILPQQVGPPKLSENASPTILQWHARFGKLRQEHAAALYELARRAIRARQPSLAYQLLLDVIRADPDHEEARRVFGYQKYDDRWRTAFEVKRLRAGMVWDEKFGWIATASLPRYQQGERQSGGRWISAEADARQHQKIESGWEVESEHYAIRTNHSIEAAVALSVKLETLHRLWQQIFLRYYASESYVESLLAGRGQQRLAEIPRFKVVYFRDGDEYHRFLRAQMPDVNIAMGMYLAQDRTAYFFAGRDDADRILYHEATHQLFQQMRRVPANIGQRGNFWLIEGIAMYMESLHQEDGYHVLGGLDDARLIAARYHLFDEDFYVPFARLSAMGMQELQTHPKVAKLYSQMAAMTHFLIGYDEGRYRDALVAALAAVYSGNQDPAILGRFTGTGYAELDRQYREFLKLRPQ